MKKLKLELDALRVESFDTAAAGAERRGTVQGAEQEEKIGVVYPASDWGSECTAPASAEGTCKTCITCRGVFTDPCLCDPIHPL